MNEIAEKKPVRKRRAPATQKIQVWQARGFHLAIWLAIVVLFFLFLDAVAPILLPFVLGGIIAYLMHPLTDRLSRWKLPRGVAAAIITILLFSCIFGLIAWLGPLLYRQLLDLVAKLPLLLQQVEWALRDDTAPLFRTLNRLNNGNGDIPNNMSEFIQQGMAHAGVVIAGLLASAGSVLNVIGLLLITPIVCFYLVRDWSGVLHKADKYLPRAYAPVIREQLHRINITLAAYLRGQLTVMLLLSIFYSIAFTILTVKYAILLGLLAGLLVIIPYIGTWISWALGLAVAYDQFGINTVWWVMLAIYVTGQFLESQILTPRIVGERVGVHPLWMLFGMLAGGVLFGVVGVLLAVPLTAVISVIVKFILERYLQSSLYTDA